MTCKRAHHYHALSVVFLVVVFTVLIAFAAPVALASTPRLFLPPVTYGSGGLAPNSVAVADVNGDGKPDIVVGNCASTSSADCGDGDGVVGVLLGNGDGTFRSAVTFSSGGSYVRALAVADVNGDSRPDVVVTNCAPSGAGACAARGLVGVLLGNGDGTFQPAVTYDSGGWGPGQVAVADVNGDGKPDLLVGNCGSSACFVDHQKVGVLLGNGDGTFQPAVTYDSGGRYPDGIAAADVNGDGKVDLIAVNVIDTSVGVLLGHGDGTFGMATIFSTGTHSDAYSVAVADVNSDGQPDILVSNCSLGNTCGGGFGIVSVLLGNGNGIFQPAVTYQTGGEEALSLAVADVNGDGKPDIVATNSYTSETVGVLLGNGDGTFKAAMTYSCGGECDAVALADVNGNGQPDVIVANSEPCYACGFIGSVGVLLGKSTTATSLISSLNPSTYGQKVTWTATVTSSGSITPTGKVKFTWSIYTVGSATLNSSGVATFTRSNLNADTFPLTAVYVGDANNVGSTSAVLNQVVRQTTSSASLTSSPNPSMQGQAVTFTAKISSPTVIPKGPVTFTAGKTVLGTAQLSGGKATLTISSLAVGSTKVTATFNGDSDIAKSSASVTQTVR